MSWAQYQPRCDICGRFMKPGAPGTSWVMVPAIDVPGWGGGDERERCPTCTQTHGRALPHRGQDEVKYDMVCGFVPLTPNAEVTCPPRAGHRSDDEHGNA